MSGRLLGGGRSTVGAVAFDRHERRSPVRSLVGLREVRLYPFRNRTIAKLELRATDEHTGDPIRAVSDISAGYDFYTVSPHATFDVEAAPLDAAVVRHTFAGSLLFGAAADDFSQAFNSDAAEFAHRLAHGVRALAVGFDLYVGNDNLLPDQCTIIGKSCGDLYRAAHAADRSSRAIFAGLAERAYAWSSVQLLAQGRVADFHRTLSVAEKWGTTQSTDAHRITNDVTQFVVAPSEDVWGDGEWRGEYRETDVVALPDMMRAFFKFRRVPDFYRNFVTRTGLALDDSMRLYTARSGRKKLVAYTCGDSPWVHCCTSAGYRGSISLDEFAARVHLSDGAVRATPRASHELPLA